MVERWNWARQTQMEYIVRSSNDWRPGEARRDGAEQNGAKVRWRDRRTEYI